MSHHSPVERLRYYLRIEKRDLWVAVIYSAVIGLLSLVVPVTVQSLVNSVAFGTVLQPLVVLTVFVLLALGFSALLQALRQYVVELMQQRIFVRVAGQVSNRLLGVQIEAFDRVHGPELVNRFLDIVTVQKSGSLLLIDGLSLLMQTTLGMILLAVYHPLLLAFDVILIASFAVILFVLGHNAVATSVAESKAKYALVAWLEEMARHLVTFKSQPGANYGLRRTDALVREYVQYRSKHFKILLRQIVGSLLLQAIASAVLLGVGGWLVIQRQLTLGQLIAAELIVSLVVSGFTKFGKQLETFYDLLAALDKLGYLTDLPMERSSGEALAVRNRPAAISLRKVSLDLPTRPDLFVDLTADIPAGSRIGLHASSGEGKSTLLELLYGLRNPSGGVVLFDDADYRDLNLRSLRGQVALIGENEIFEGTIAENLHLGSREVHGDELREALRQAGLLYDILSLPDGLQTYVATEGSPLSPSQAMRLMIARAIVLRPRLLLVDELLDQLAQRDRQVVMDTLFAPDAPWTLLVVSHEKDVLGRCEQVWKLHEGRLERDGHILQAAK